MLRVRWTSQLAPFAALCAVLVVNAAVGLQVHTHNNSPRRRQRSCANTYCGSHESSWNVCGCMCTVGPGGMCNSCCGCSCVHSCPSGTTSSGRKALSTCTVKAGSYGKAGMQPGTFIRSSTMSVHARARIRIPPRHAGALTRTHVPAAQATAPPRAQQALRARLEPHR